MSIWQSAVRSPNYSGLFHIRIQTFDGFLYCFKQTIACDIVIVNQIDEKVLIVNFID